MQLHRLQQDFSKAMRGVPSSIADQICDTPISAKDRLSIYENNIIASLSDALADTFPATLALVGEAFFSTLARDFILSHPPTSPALLRYGAGFAEHIAAYDAAAHLTYLADVAHLEWAWSIAYHADDDAPLTADSFSQIPPQRYDKLVLGLRSSVQLIGSPWPIDRICAHCLTQNNDELDISNDPVALLIWRPENDVQLLRLTPSEQAFFTAITAGATLENAYDAAASKEPNFALGEHLSRYFGLGVFAA